MKIGVPKEIHTDESRVATTPGQVKELIKLGFEVAVEQGAGVAAQFPNWTYEQSGAKIVEDTKAIWTDSDIVLKVRPPEFHPILKMDEAELLQKGSVLISFIWPAQNDALMKQLAARGVTVMAMDSVPRISRAQKMDALSSMANIAGYRAVIEAANYFGRFFTGQITAAGRVPPAKVLVIGAGVAGLAAIGTATSMGAIVRAFDTRPEVKEQVESLDAEFLTVDIEEESHGSGGYAKQMSQAFIDAEMELFRKQAEEVDIIITTALIPGKPAPKLITEDMVKSMRQGSVIVDMAAEQGGNCESTEPGAVVAKDGVTLIGYMDLPSRLATQSSALYANNLRHLLTDLTPNKDGQIEINMDDEVIRSATVIKDGEITWPPPPVQVSAAPPAAKAAEPVVPPEETKMSPAARSAWTAVGMTAAIALILAIGSVAPASFMGHFTVFILAIFVGWQVVWSVTPALHTPLMSVTNAISGIIVLGALLQVGSSAISVTILAAIAVLIATINITGGFLVTQRMLKMFRR